MMTIDEFTNQVLAARQRADMLLQQARGQETGLPEAYYQLEEALEELSVANEELRAQNAELLEARGQVEAERQRYQELFDFAPDGYIVTTPEGVILEANRAAARLLNTSQEALLHKPFTAFMPPTARQDFRGRLSSLNRSNQINTWIMQLQPRKTPPFDAAVSVGVVMGQAGKPESLRWLFRDISAQKRAEEVRRRSEFVVQADRILASSLNLDKTLTQVEQILVPAFADLCLIHLRAEDGTIGRVETAHYNPQRGKQLKALESRHPLDLSSSHPAAFVLRTGKRRFFFQVDEALLQTLARKDRYLKQLREFRLQSLMALPLRARGHMIGALTVGTEGDRRFGPSDLVLAQDLARHIAQAIDNATQHDELRLTLHDHDHALAQTVHELLLHTHTIAESTLALKGPPEQSPAAAAAIAAALENIDNALARLKQSFDSLHGRPEPDSDAHTTTDDSTTPM